MLAASEKIAESMESFQIMWTYSQTMQNCRKTKNGVYDIAATWKINFNVGKYKVAGKN